LPKIYKNTDFDQIRSDSTSSLIKVDKPQPYKHKTMIEVNVNNKNEKQYN